MVNRSKFKVLLGIAISICVTAGLVVGVLSHNYSMVYPAMTKAETNRCDQLEVSVNRTGRISANDLNWAFGMLRTPSWTAKLPDTQQRHLEVMIAFKKLRSFAPGQEEQLYQATTAFLSSPDEDERVGAMAVMRATQDKRAIPAVLALLNVQDSFTRQMAHKTLGVLEASGSRT